VKLTDRIARRLRNVRPIDAAIVLPVLALVGYFLAALMLGWPLPRIDILSH
jgi:hypothetical protein